MLLTEPIDSASLCNGSIGIKPNDMNELLDKTKQMVIPSVLLVILASTTDSIITWSREWKETLGLNLSE